MISITRFPFTFGSLSDADSLFQFRFKRTDVLRMVNAVGWPDGMTHTTRNRYEVCPLLVTCVILRSAASPGRWRDSECLFGKQQSQHSEIFWEGLGQFVEHIGKLIAGDISSTLVYIRASEYAKAAFEKVGTLPNRVGFIDGTVIGISSPGDLEEQRVL
jgi:hypothetical protein